MNTTLPSMRATPRPSCDSDSITTVAMSPEAVDAGAGSVPAGKEFMEMRFVRFAQRLSYALGFALVTGVVQVAADQLVAQIHEIGVERIGLAIIADLADLSGQVSLPHVGTTAAHL